MNSRYIDQRSSARVCEIAYVIAPSYGCFYLFGVMCSETAACVDMSLFGICAAQEKTRYHKLPCTYDAVCYGFRCLVKIWYVLASQRIGYTKPFRLNRIYVAVCLSLFGICVCIIDAGPCISAAVCYGFRCLGHVPEYPIRGDAGRDASMLLFVYPCLEAVYIYPMMRWCKQPTI
jgi:hypothetical protein